MCRHLTTGPFCVLLSLRLSGASPASSLLFEAVPETSRAVIKSLVPCGMHQWFHDQPPFVAGEKAVHVVGPPQAPSMARRTLLMCSRVPVPSSTIDIQRW